MEREEGEGEEERNNHQETRRRYLQTVDIGCPGGSNGITLESTILKPETPPSTRPCVSTTASGSLDLPILPVLGDFHTQVS